MPSPTYYSDSSTQTVQSDEIIRLLRELGVGSANSDSLTTTELNEFQAEVDSFINSRLSPLFHVPLTKIKRPGRFTVSGTEQEFFPDPIPMIARRLVAAEITFTVYREVDTVSITKTEDVRERALSDLDNLIQGMLRGTRDLEGQMLKSRNRFVPPTIAPNEPPMLQT